jgi:hypothetical protein
MIDRGVAVLGADSGSMLLGLFVGLVIVWLAFSVQHRRSR